jgi:hypothetical protein
MWIFTKYGFFSVVKSNESNDLMIRSRNKKHLENLKNKFDKLQNFEILRTKDADYRYRIIISKEIWSNIMSELSENIDYSNFKNKVYETLKDKNLNFSLGDIWNIMYNYQRDIESLGQ